MKLPEVEVYEIEKIGRESACGFLKKDGRKIILKPRKNFIDEKVIQFLHKIEMQSIPHLIGRVDYDSNSYLVFSWLEGSPISSLQLEEQEILKVLKKILKLLELLKKITANNWYFLDLKAEHILLTKTGIPALIDFEHVLTDGKEKIAWKEIKEVGLSSIFCSPEIKKEYLTKNHHEYALALICLSLLTGKEAGLLRAKTRKKALEKLPAQYKKSLESALQCKGLNIGENSSLKSFDNIKNKNNSGVISDLNNNLSVTLAADFSKNINSKKDTALTVATKRVERVDDNFIIDQKEQSIDSSLFNFILAKFQKHIINKNLKNDLAPQKLADNLKNYYSMLYKSAASANTEKDYIHQFEFKETLQINTRLIIFNTVEIITLCDCHLLPAFHTLNLSFLAEKDKDYNYESMRNKILQCSGQIMPSNILTKYLARLIVKQYDISDLFLYSKSNSICQKYSLKSYNEICETEQIKFGIFTRNEILCEKVIQLITT